MPPKRRLYCPSCGSDNLRSLGSNGIEPKPGYVCEHCSQKLRRRGSGWFYAGVMTLGLVMVPVGAGSLIWSFFEWGFSCLSAVAFVGGLICFVYAVLRLTHPAPLLERPELDYRPPAAPPPPPEAAEPTERPVPPEQPAAALPVWRVTGVLAKTGVAVVREVEAESAVDAATVAELNGMTVTRVDRLP